MHVGMLHLLAESRKASSAHLLAEAHEAPSVHFLAEAHKAPYVHLLAEAHKASSVHVTFNTQEEAELLERECGFMSRIGMQFHWCGSAMHVALSISVFHVQAFSPPRLVALDHHKPPYSVSPSSLLTLLLLSASDGA